VLTDADAAALYDLTNPWDSDVDTLNTDFEIENQFGDWQKGPVTGASRLVLAVARRRP
jgi:hypothetical protein